MPGLPPPSPSDAASAPGERDRQYRLLFETMELGVVYQDLTGRIIDMNPAAERILGYRHDEFLGETSVTVEGNCVRSDGSPFPGTEHPSMVALRTGCKVGPVEMGVLNPREGAWRWLSVTAAPEFRPGERTPHRVYAIFQDITDRRRAEHALLQADRRKDEFLATLAHELRNPLAPLRHALDLLGLAGTDAARIEQARGLMERQLRQLVRLIDDLLDLSRISTGKLTLRREPIDLGQVLRSAVETTAPLMRSLEHRLSLDLAAGPLPVLADVARLTQILTNLLTNAAKYTAPGGRIRVEAARDGNDVRVAVHDNGVGIAREHLSSIFEMFNQVQGKRGNGDDGLGIGLHLAQRLVSMHDGQIEALSEGLGRGSTFVVRLPASHSVPKPAIAPHPRPGGDDDAGGPPRADAAASIGPPAGVDPAAAGVGGHSSEPLLADALAGPERLDVLVVDDNADAADSLSLLLSIAGHRVHTAYDGADGMALAERTRPRVLLLDLGMPAMDGFEVARRVRATDWGRHAYIAAISGWGQAIDKQRSREAGFDAHLVKPLDLQQLQRLLSSIGRGIARRT